MKGKIRRRIITIVCITLISALFVSCNNERNGSNGDPNKELSVWCTLYADIALMYFNYAEMPLYKELEKKTGIKIKFQHPAAGQQSEQFNLLVASGDLPDIIANDWLGYPGGPERAMTDKVIIPLNDLIENHAPNLKKFISENKEYDKMIKTDSGNYYVFPFIRGDEFLYTYRGIIIRKDWLDEEGLDIPSTISEWHNALTAFKKARPDISPLTFSSFAGAVAATSAFLGAFGTGDGFYIQDGKVVYGALEPGYEKFVRLMRTWYEEGLIDKDFATNDSNALNSKMLSSRAGSTIAQAGSGLGRYLDYAKQENISLDFVGCPYPVLTKGQKPEFGHRMSSYEGIGSYAITVKCADKELAAKWCDYGYGAEGHMLYNFGIEGVSYNLEDGYPRYTDLILKNPEGLSVSQALNGYARSLSNGPFVQDKRYFEQYMAHEQQKEAINRWSNTNAAAHALPPVTYTEEESLKFSKIMNDINTFKDEMLIKFVIGMEPISNYSNFVKQLHIFNIEEAISVVQGAVDRYDKR
ncbi:MAG: extracellular solute-binding protein [Firmicutes bacterium]|nr:extracellular solute-binding protein [Bacillota bacterium]